MTEAEAQIVWATIKAMVLGIVVLSALAFVAGFVVRIWIGPQ